MGVGKNPHVSILLDRAYAGNAIPRSLFPGSEQATKSEQQNSPAKGCGHLTKPYPIASFTGYPCFAYFYTMSDKASVRLYYSHIRQTAKGRQKQVLRVSLGGCYAPAVQDIVMGK